MRSRELAQLRRYSSVPPYRLNISSVFRFSTSGGRPRKPYHVFCTKHCEFSGVNTQTLVALVLFCCFFAFFSTVSKCGLEEDDKPRFVFLRLSKSCLEVVFWCVFYHTPIRQNIMTTDKVCEYTSYFFTIASVRAVDPTCRSLSTERSHAQPQ